jgi:hypothetical protein
MTMVRRVTVASALVAVLAGLSAGPEAALAQEPFEWSGDLSRDQFLEVKGIVGDVNATLAPGSRARVVARKHGDRRDFDEVQVRAVEERGGVVVCVIYGSWRFDNEGCDNGNWDDNDGRHHRQDIDVSVEFEVQVPSGVEFFGASVTGDVEAEGLESDVEASSVSGDVRVSTTGMVRANTVSGELDISMGSLDWDRLEFSTVSGDITLRLPDNLGAEVEFNSLSGDFRSDFDLDREDRDEHRWVGLDVSGIIGDGSRRLSMNTVSGDVELRRRR